MLVALMVAMVVVSLVALVVVFMVAAARQLGLHLLVCCV